MHRNGQVTKSQQKLLHLSTFIGVQYGVSSLIIVSYCRENQFQRMEKKTVFSFSRRGGGAQRSFELQKHKIRTIPNNNKRKKVNSLVD